MHQVVDLGVLAIGIVAVGVAIGWVLRGCVERSGKEAESFRFDFGPRRPKRKEDSVELSLSTVQEQIVLVTPLDASKQRAKIDGAVAFEVVSGLGSIRGLSDDDCNQIVQAQSGRDATADELADLKARGQVIVSADVADDDPAGTQAGTLIAVKADADLGAGKQEIASSILLHSTHPMADALDIVSVLAPRAKQPAAPAGQ